MNTTSLSLLQRVRQPADASAWQRFVDLYSPLLYRWARAAGLQDQDAADLVQEILTALVQKLPHFEYQEQKCFRAWLRTMLMNKWRDWQRRRALLDQRPLDAVAELVSPESEKLLEEAEYRQYVIGRARELIRQEFQPATWQAFWEHGVQARAASKVAEELGMSVGAVYAARFRVFNRLKEELQGLLE